MKLSSPPVTVANLTAWFVFVVSKDGVPAYAVLEEAMENGYGLVRETRKVNELVIDNPGDVEIFIQAGDLVRGGRQDRSIGVDFVVPPRAEGLPLPVFCVESDRWSRRRNESDQVFQSSKDLVASKKVRAAMRMAKDQGEVWDTIAEHQTKLGESVGASVKSAVSPSSLQLSYEMKEAASALKGYAAAMESALPENAAGVVWCINGQPSHADVYADSRLFKKVWNKLLRAAALESIAERLEAGSRTEFPVAEVDSVLQWLEAARKVPAEGEVLPPRTVATMRRTPTQVRIETVDTSVSVPVHISVFAL